MTDRIFYHIGPLFTLSPTWQPRKSKFWNNLKTPGDIIILTHKHHIWKSYVWSLRYGARWTKYFVIWDCFFPFTPLMTQKFKILKNWKNEKQKQKQTPGGIIILQMCTINDNHMINGSWDMECDSQIFCHFGPFVCPFTHLTQKIKILKKMKKKLLDTSSFYTSVPKIMII